MTSQVSADGNAARACRPVGRRLSSRRDKKFDDPWSTITKRPAAYFSDEFFLQGTYDEAFGYLKQIKFYYDIKIVAG